MTSSNVRGVAILDRNDRVRLLETLHCDTTTARLWIEKVLHASVDVLDEKKRGASAITLSASSNSTATNTANASMSSDNEETPGLYLGQLATQGRLTVYGFVTSVQMRCLVCFETDGVINKVDDMIARNILWQLCRLYVEETAANPFSASDQEGAVRMNPITFQDTARLLRITAEPKNMDETFRTQPAHTG